MRRSLVEYANGDCVFFDSERRSCKVYALRPRQCRTWPFWESNLRHPRPGAELRLPGCEPRPGGSRWRRSSRSRGS